MKYYSRAFLYSIKHSLILAEFNLLLTTFTEFRGSKFSFLKTFTTCELFAIVYHSQPEATLHKQAYYDITCV